jgi:ribonuclease VapC
MSRNAVAIVDSWAALALLRGEEPATTVMRRYLRRAHARNLRLVMSLVNLGEVNYRLIQLLEEERADEGLRRLRQLPIEVLPVRESLVMEAARLKARHRLSYADAFAVAAARLEKGSVLTGDPEIRALPPGVVRVITLQRDHDR